MAPSLICIVEDFTNKTIDVSMSKHFSASVSLEVHNKLRALQISSNMKLDPGTASSLQSYQAKMLTALTFQGSILPILLSMSKPLLKARKVQLTILRSLIKTEAAKILTLLSDSSMS